MLHFTSLGLLNYQNRLDKVASSVGSIFNTSPFEQNNKGEWVPNQGFQAEDAIKVVGTYSATLYVPIDEVDFTGVTSASRLIAAASGGGDRSMQDYYKTINGFTGGDANIKVDAFAAALIFIPGEGFLIKGVVGINKYGKCIQFANSFIKKYGGEKIIINIGKYGIIGTKSTRLSDNGYHEVVLKTIDGSEYIFDNFHSRGILKSEYIKEIEGYVNGHFISGEEIFSKYAK